MEILIGIFWNVRHAVSRRLSKISVDVYILSEHILNVKYARVRKKRCMPPCRYATRVHVEYTEWKRAWERDAWKETYARDV